MNDFYLLSSINIKGFEILQLIVDFGMFLLIWLVQLVVYPVMLYIDESNLQSWHVKYTKVIIFFIFPLMGIQLSFLLYELTNIPDASTLSMAFFIFIAWIITFFYAIPLHRKVAVSKDTILIRKRLVQLNWLRTIAWTATFFISVYRVLLLNPL